MLNLFIKALKDGVKYPVQAHPSDAGWDIYATEETIVHPNNPLKLSTGIALQAKFADPKDAEKFKIKIQIEGTSGNAAKLKLFPIGGVVDEAYTGEIGVVLVNGGNDPVKIEKDKKIAQFVPEVLPKINKVVYLGAEDEFGATERGTAGFGSTGTASD